MRIGVLGCGQAGSRISLVLKTFDPAVELIVCDPHPRSAVLDRTNAFSVDPIILVSEDEEFFDQQFDKLIIAADPLSLLGTAARPGTKPLMLAAMENKDISVLAERPLGYRPEHPSDFITQTGLRNVSVLNYAANSPLSKFLAAYEPRTIAINATLNCGLADKRWRQQPDLLPLPVHFADQYFSLLNSRSGDLSINSATVRRSSSGDFEYDQEWTILASTPGGVTATLLLSQYAGASEYQFSHDRIRATGLGFTAEIDFSGYSIALSDGATDSYDHRLATASDAIRPAAARLHSYLVEVESYPNVAAVEGLARSIAESVIKWHSDNALLVAGRLSLVESESRSMALAHQAVEIAAQL